MEIAIMWKTKVIILLIVSTTADAVTNFDDLSLGSSVGDEASLPGGHVAQGVGDLGRDIAPTMLHERSFLAACTNGALSEIAFAADVTTQERPTAL